MQIVENYQPNEKVIAEESFLFNAFKHSKRGRRLAGTIMGIFLGIIFLTISTVTVNAGDVHGTVSVVIVITATIVGYGAGKLLGMMDPHLPDFFENLSISFFRPTEEEFEAYKTLLQTQIAHEKEADQAEIKKRLENTKRLEKIESLLPFKLPT